MILSTFCNNTPIIWNFDRVFVVGLFCIGLLCMSSYSRAQADERGGVSPAAESPAVGAYVYTQLQASMPFDTVPWQIINPKLRQQPGVINKTWLSGVGDQAPGGLYAFDTIENAQQFVTQYFPAEARGMGVGQTTRVFDAVATKTASEAMGSPYWNKQLVLPVPGAYVYTEVQVDARPFHSQAPWESINKNLRKQPGLICKTWLSGVNNGTVGGFYAFDTIENAARFALDVFPLETQALNAAYTARVFDAAITREASEAMNSPYFRKP